jgi:hypothetical protein
MSDDISKITIIKTITVSEEAMSEAFHALAMAASEAQDKATEFRETCLTWTNEVAKSEMLAIAARYEKKRDGFYAVRSELEHAWFA